MSDNTVSDNQQGSAIVVLEKRVIYETSENSDITY